MAEFDGPLGQPSPVSSAPNATLPSTLLDGMIGAAADALFQANELWPSFSKSVLAHSLGGPREARLRTARVAVEAAVVVLLDGCEVREEWGAAARVHDGELLECWRGPRNAAEAVIASRLRNRWRFHSQLVSRLHLATPAEVVSS